MLGNFSTPPHVLVFFSRAMTTRRFLIYLADKQSSHALPFVMPAHMRRGNDGILRYHAMNQFTFTVVLLSEQTTKANTHLHPAHLPASCCEQFFASSL